MSWSDYHHRNISVVMEIWFALMARLFSFSSPPHGSSPSFCCSKHSFSDVSIPNADRKCRSGASRTGSPSFDSYCVAVEAFFDEEVSRNALVWSLTIDLLFCFYFIFILSLDWAGVISASADFRLLLLPLFASVMASDDSGNFEVDYVEKCPRCRYIRVCFSLMAKNLCTLNVGCI